MNIYVIFVLFIFWCEFIFLLFVLWNFFILFVIFIELFLELLLGVGCLIFLGLRGISFGL